MFNIIGNQPNYDQNAVQPMRDELVAVGFKELLSAEEVKQTLEVNDDKFKLVFVNSVCGCAAGSARPGISLALQNKLIPDELYTVFAGQEKDAVAELRNSFLKAFPPSSPCIAIIKNAELVFFMQRYDIEGYEAESIADQLIKTFDELCSRQGPSISPERFKEIEYAKVCGSKIPLHDQN